MSPEFVLDAAPVSRSGAARLPRITRKVTKGDVQLSVRVTQGRSASHNTALSAATPTEERVSAGCAVRNEQATAVISRNVGAVLEHSAPAGVDPHIQAR